MENFDDIKENIKGILSKSRSSSKERKDNNSENVSQLHDFNPSIDDHSDTGSKPIQHKLGQLLFSIIKNPSNKDIDKFCTNFDEYLSIHDSHQKTSQSQLKEELKQEFSNHLFTSNTTNPDITHEVKDPSFFGSESIAQNEKKQNLLRHLLPAEKFSGGNNIIQFLDCMTYAQDILKMTEDDFKYHFVRMTSGPVYEYLRTSFMNGSSISDTYKYLLSVYHIPLQSDVALKILTNFKADKSMTFSKLHSKVLQLATAASKISPIHTRQSFINIYASTFLIQALPPISSLKANNTYQSLLAQKKDVRYLDLVNALSKFNESINKDILANGVHPSENRKRNVNHLKKENFTQKNSLPNKQNFSSKKSFTENTSYSNSNNKSIFRPQNQRRQLDNIKRSYHQPSPVPRKKFKVNNIKYNNNTKNTSPSKYSNTKKHCVLCGYTNHTASNCFNMIDDQSKRHDIPPSFSHCQKCFQHFSKKLFHPPKFCILREKYIEIKNNLKKKKSQ